MAAIDPLCPDMVRHRPGLAEIGVTWSRFRATDSGRTFWAPAREPMWWTPWLRVICSVGPPGCCRRRSLVRASLLATHNRPAPMLARCPRRRFRPKLGWTDRPDGIVRASGQTGWDTFDQIRPTSIKLGPIPSLGRVRPSRQNLFAVGRPTLAKFGLIRIPTFSEGMRRGISLYSRAWMARGLERGSFRETPRKWTPGANIFATRGLHAQIRIRTAPRRHGAPRRVSIWHLAREPITSGISDTHPRMDLVVAGPLKRWPPRHTEGAKLLTAIGVAHLVRNRMGEALEVFSAARRVLEELRCASVTPSLL